MVGCNVRWTAARGDVWGPRQPRRGGTPAITTFTRIYIRSFMMADLGFYLIQ